MDESKILALISRGENPTLDFKESLVIDKGYQKAEFIKDVLSIANSSPDEGHLLIGVDDNQMIVGIDNLEEERIQQIIRAYITPPISVKCDLIPVASAGFQQVGVISIQGTNRPHKVARSIDKIYQDEVYIRHGSVVSKASPEEIINMHLFSREVLQYTRAAEIHFRLGNLENAITAYSKAIEIAPSAQLLFVRSQATLKLLEGKTKESWDSRKPLVEKVLKDLNDVIILSESDVLIYDARKLRWDFSYRGYQNYTDLQSDEDYNFIKGQLEGEEFGRWIYNEMISRDLFIDDDKKTLSIIEEIIESGYQDPDVYEFLARTHTHMRNYGLALEVIERLLEDEKIDDKHLAYNLSLKADILVEFQMYKEAFNIANQAAELRPTNQSFHIWDFPEDILFRYILSHHFGSEIYPPMDKMLLYLIYFFSRDIRKMETSNDGTKILNWKTRLDDLEKKFPGFKRLLHEYVGEKNWELLEDIYQQINLSLKIPSLQEFLNDKSNTFISIPKTKGQ